MCVCAHVRACVRVCVYVVLRAYLAPPLPLPSPGLTPIIQTERSKDPIVVDLPLPLSKKIRDFQRYARPVLVMGRGDSEDHEALLVTSSGKPLTDVTLAQLWASIQESHRAPWGVPVTLSRFRHGYATRAHAAVLNGIAVVGPAVLQPQANAMGNSLRMWREVYVDGRRSAIAQTATHIAAQAANLTSDRGARMHDAGVGTDGPGPSKVVRGSSGVGGDPWQSRQPQPFENEGCSADESEWCTTESAGTQSGSSPSESTCSSGSDGGEDDEMFGPSGVPVHAGSMEKRRSYGGVPVTKVAAKKRHAYFVGEELESSPPPSPTGSDDEHAGVASQEQKRPRLSVGPVSGPEMAGGSGAVERVGSQPNVVMRNACEAGPSTSNGMNAGRKTNAGWLSFLATGNR